MEKEMPKTNFESSNYYFVSIYESGSCPYELKKTKVNEFASEIIFYISYKSNVGEECTSDATPRTIIVEVGKKADQAFSKDIENAAIVYHAGYTELRTTEKIKK
jgi:hypothetical protein